MIKKKHSLKKILLSLLIAVILIGGIAAAFVAYLLPWKNVYATVNGTKVYNYRMSYEMLEFAQKFNVSPTAFVTDDPHSNAARQMVTENARNETMYTRLLYLMGVKDGFTATQDEVDNAIASFKKTITPSSGQTLEQAYSDELSSMGLTEKDYVDLIKENIISQKEKDKLTANITITDKELKSYFDEWGFGYDPKNPDRQAVYAKNIEQIKKDALLNKKNDYIASYERQLLADNMSGISFDNPYKKFMRWWYGSFLGETIPDQYKPETSMG
ncbi:MAG: SurA N-terminal domain-containing protein [Caldisericaceae bacterium]